MLKAAFKTLLGLHKRSVTLKRGVSTLTVHITPSNYSRGLAGPSETIIEGRQYVIDKDQLTGVFAGGLKRGDAFVDAELGTLYVNEINEMFDFGGAIMGYRVTTK